MGRGGSVLVPSSMQRGSSGSSRNGPKRFRFASIRGSLNIRGPLLPDIVSKRVEGVAGVGEKLAGRIGRIGINIIRLIDRVRIAHPIVDLRIITRFLVIRGIPLTLIIV